MKNLKSFLLFRFIFYLLQNPTFIDTPKLIETACKIKLTYVISTISFAGDAYVLGKETEKGFKNLIRKYGKICGFWLGPQRTVVVADFEILQELLNKPETSNRRNLAVAG